MTLSLKRIPYRLQRSKNTTGNGADGTIWVIWSLFQTPAGILWRSVPTLIGLRTKRRI